MPINVLVSLSLSLSLCFCISKNVYVCTHVYRDSTIIRFPYESKFRKMEYSILSIRTEFSKIFRMCVFSFFSLDRGKYRSISGYINLVLVSSRDIPQVFLFRSNVSSLSLSLSPLGFQFRLLIWRKFISPPTDKIHGQEN